MINRDDIDAINVARSRYNARRTESNLIAWICSVAWTEVPAHTASRGSFLRSGSSDLLLLPSGEVSGEIADEPNGTCDECGERALVRFVDDKLRCANVCRRCVP